MKIVRTVATDCPNGVDCSKVQELSDGNHLVRGYVMPETAQDRHTVAVPHQVYDQAAAVLGDRLTGGHRGQLDSGHVRYRGHPLTRDQLASLNLPDGEHAVLAIRHQEVTPC